MFKNLKKNGENYENILRKIEQTLGQRNYVKQIFRKFLYNTGESCKHFTKVVYRK